MTSRLYNSTYSSVGVQVLKAAEEMGLSQIETEDYCFRETLGKNLSLIHI